MAAAGDAGTAALQRDLGGKGTRGADCCRIRRGVAQETAGRSPPHCPHQAVPGCEPSEAQARGAPGRSSPSGSTAIRSTSAAAAIAAHAVPPPPAPPSLPRAPPLSPLPTSALLTSHPAEGGGEGESQPFGQSRAGTRGPAPCHASLEGGRPADQRKSAAGGGGPSAGTREGRGLPDPGVR